MRARGTCRGGRDVGTDMLLTGWFVHGNAMHFDGCLWSMLVAWYRTTRHTVVCFVLGLVVVVGVLFAIESIQTPLAICYAKSVHGFRL